MTRCLVKSQHNASHNSHSERRSTLSPWLPSTGPVAHKVQEMFQVRDSGKHTRVSFKDCIINPPILSSNAFTLWCLYRPLVISENLLTPVHVAVYHNYQAQPDAAYCWNLFFIVGLLIHLAEYVINQQFLVKDFSRCIIILIIIIIIIIVVVVVVVVVEAFKECSTLGVTNREFSWQPGFRWIKIRTVQLHYK